MSTNHALSKSTVGNAIGAAIIALVLLALALTMPAETAHEREIRSAISTMAQSLPARSFGEVVFRGIAWGLAEQVRTDPSGSVIRLANWRYRKLLFLSVVTDDEPGRERIVSVGLLGQVYVNPKKFEP